MKMVWHYDKGMQLGVVTLASRSSDKLASSRMLGRAKAVTKSRQVVVTKTVDSSSFGLTHLWGRQSLVAATIGFVPTARGVLCDGRAEIVLSKQIPPTRGRVGGWRTVISD